MDAAAEALSQASWGQSGARAHSGEPLQPAGEPQCMAGLRMAQGKTDPIGLLIPMWVFSAPQVLWVEGQTLLMRPDSLTTCLSRPRPLSGLRRRAEQSVGRDLCTTE